LEEEDSSNRCIINISGHLSCTILKNVVTHNLIIPSVYIVNANSLAKENAKQLFISDMISCNAEMVLVTEMHFKSHHDHTDCQTLVVSVVFD